MPSEDQKFPGLTSAEVILSRQKNGSNKETSHDFATLKIISKTIFSVFNIVMAILISVMVIVGQGSSAKFIGVVAVINTLIELTQEIRARLIIKKLNTLNNLKVKVIRDGKSRELPTGQIVIDDIISLSSGDSIPVDGTILLPSFAEFDESILTGESKYINKKVGDQVLAGSFIIAGSCLYKVTKLAKDSYFQTLTKQVSQFGIVESPLQSQINQIIKALTYMTVFFIILIFAEGLISQNEISEIIINSATLVTSMVPQGLVLITTISFAYGAMKLASSQAIVQRLSAIEAMANTKVVCMDKTGTLTKNDLVVKEVKEV